MRVLIILCTTAIVLALGVWAFQETHKTQMAQAEVETLERDIAKARDRLFHLKTEWAFLNRPERLLDLADMNFQRLELLEVSVDQFSYADQIKFRKKSPEGMTGQAVSLVEEERP